MRYILHRTVRSWRQLEKYHSAIEKNRGAEMTEKKQAKDQDQFIVRLPDGMRDRIKAAAAENNRSMNAEIVDALVEKFPPNMHDLWKQAAREVRNIAFQYFSEKNPDIRRALHRQISDRFRRAGFTKVGMEFTDGEVIFSTGHIARYAIDSPSDG